MPAVDNQAESRVLASANNYGFGPVDDSSNESLVAYRKHLESTLATVSCSATTVGQDVGHLEPNGSSDEVAALRILVQKQQADLRAAVDHITQAQGFLAPFGGRQRLAAWRTSVTTLLQKLGQEKGRTGAPTHQKPTKSTLLA